MRASPWLMVGPMLLAFACARSTPAASSAQPSTPVDAPSSAPADTSAPAALGPGPAYFAMHSVGVAMLDESGWSMVDTDAERVVSDMFVGPDGEVYVLDFAGLSMIVDGQLQLVVEFTYKDIGSVSNLVMAGDGALWATNYKGVGYFFRGTWHIVEKEALGIDMLTGVALGGDGVPVISASKSLLRLDGDRWTEVDLSALGEDPYVFRLAAGPDGYVYAQTSRSLFRLQGFGGEVIPLEGGALGYSSALEFGPSGEVAVASYMCDVARLDPAAPASDATWRLAAGEVECRGFRSLALDGASRVWLASPEGLNVVDADGDNHFYPSGSVPELISPVQQMVVVGDGPTLPEVGVVRTGGLSGTFTLDGDVVASTKLEICPTVSVYTPQGPCAGSVVAFAGETDRDGKFDFDDIPLGSYQFALLIDGQWQTFYVPEFSARMREGQTLELGTLALQRPEDPQ